MWEVQEIDGEVELPHGDQTGHHSVVSQFLSVPRTTHFEAVMKILRYLKKGPGGELLSIQIMDTL